MLMFLSVEICLIAAVRNASLATKGKMPVISAYLSCAMRLAVEGSISKSESGISEVEQESKVEQKEAGFHFQTNPTTLFL